MPPVLFKLKQANAQSQLTSFDGLPDWERLASRITEMFNIPSKHVGVAFVDEAQETFILTDDHELQLFYESLDQASPRTKITFVVQDRQTPDGKAAFSSQYPSPMSDIRIRSHCLSAFLITFKTCCLL